MIQRIKKGVGLEPLDTGDAFVNGGWKTVITFIRELTATEKTTLDTIMADNPTFPPATTGSKFIIDDIEAKKAQVEQQMGLTFDLFYIETTPGSGVIDEIIIQFSRQLTNSEKNKVKGIYAGLIREVV